jgi:site-specific recombinase XerD
MVQDLKLAGYSPVTARIYLHYAKHFAKYFMCSPDQMGEREVRAFLLHLLEERKLGHGSYRQAYSALKFLYCVTLDRPFEVEAIPRRRKAKPLPVVLSGSEIRELLGGFRSPKYRTVTMVLYGAGLRVFEACRLRVADIDSRRMLIHVREGKGRKDRYVMLSQRLLEALRSHWKIHRSQGFLFPGQSGDGHLSTEAVRSAMRRVATRIGLKKRVSPHLLRHSFATHLLEIGTDVTVVQAVLGHRYITATARYTSISTRLIRRIRSPLDVLEAPEGQVLG